MKAIEIHDQKIISCILQIYYTYITITALTDITSADYFFSKYTFTLHFSEINGFLSGSRKITNFYSPCNSHSSQHTILNYDDKTQHFVYFNNSSPHSNN